MINRSCNENATCTSKLNLQSFLVHMLTLEKCTTNSEVVGRDDYKSTSIKRYEVAKNLFLIFLRSMGVKFINENEQLQSKIVGKLVSEKSCLDSQKKDGNRTEKKDEEKKAENEESINAEEEQKCEKRLGSKANKTTMDQQLSSRPSITGDNIRQLKNIVEKVVKEHKTFCIEGQYSSIRSAMKQRGWLEKREGKWNNSKELKVADSFQSLILQESEKVSPEIKNVDPVVVSRLLKNTPADFLWTAKASCAMRHEFRGNQLISRFPRTGFNTKVGLCTSLEQMHWFYEEGVSHTLFPRCYNICTSDELSAFKDDFRLTACQGLLKWVIKKYDEHQTSALGSPAGKIPPSCVDFAVKRCNTFISIQNHEDIDKDDNYGHVWDYQWDQFLTWYYMAVHEGHMLLENRNYKPEVLYQAAKETLEVMKNYWPQQHLDGMLNVWILKPGANSRGRGIILLNKLETALSKVRNYVMKESRFVIQKYMEEPLLIYKTKFDIRQWFLITCAEPLTIWMYKSSYLRFCSQSFDLKNFHESVHLCNNAVQCKYKNGKRDPNLPEENMWDCYTFQTYLRAQGKSHMWSTKIYPGMRQSIIGAILSAQDNLDRRKNCFELFGADFMLDKEFTPWLLEINSCPSMCNSTSVTARLCSQCLEDVIKVVIDRRYDRKADTGQFELVFKQQMPPYPTYLGMILSVKGEKLVQDKTQKSGTKGKGGTKQSKYEKICQDSSGDSDTDDSSVVCDIPHLLVTNDDNSSSKSFCDDSIIDDNNMCSIPLSPTGQTQEYLEVQSVTSQQDVEQTQTSDTDNVESNCKCSEITETEDSNTQSKIHSQLLHDSQKNSMEVLVSEIKTDDTSTNIPKVKSSHPQKRKSKNGNEWPSFSDTHVSSHLQSVIDDRTTNINDLKTFSFFDTKSFTENITKTKSALKPIINNFLSNEINSVMQNTSDTLQNEIILSKLKTKEILQTLPCIPTLKSLPSFQLKPFTFTVDESNALGASLSALCDTTSQMSNINSLNNSYNNESFKAETKENCNTSVDLNNFILNFINDGVLDQFCKNVTEDMKMTCKSHEESPGQRNNSSKLTENNKSSKYQKHGSVNGILSLQQQKDNVEKHILTHVENTAQKEPKSEEKRLTQSQKRSYINIQTKSHVRKKKSRLSKIISEQMNEQEDKVSSKKYSRHKHKTEKNVKMRIDSGETASNCLKRDDAKKGIQNENYVSSLIKSTNLAKSYQKISNLAKLTAVKDNENFTVQNKYSFPKNKSPEREQASDKKNTDLEDKFTYKLDHDIIKPVPRVQVCKRNQPFKTEKVWSNPVSVTETMQGNRVKTLSPKNYSWKSVDETQEVNSEKELDNFDGWKERLARTKSSCENLLLQLKIFNKNDSSIRKTRQKLHNIQRMLHDNQTYMRTAGNKEDTGDGTDNLSYFQVKKKDTTNLNVDTLEKQKQYNVYRNRRFSNEVKRTAALLQRENKLSANKDYDAPSEIIGKKLNIERVLNTSFMLPNIRHKFIEPTSEEEENKSIYAVGLGLDGFKERNALLFPLGRAQCFENSKKVVK